MGIGIIYRNAIARRLADGRLSVITVPELKEMGIKSVIAYEGCKPLSSIAQEFLTLLRQRATRVKIDNGVTGRALLNRGEPKLSKRQHVSAKTARKYPLPRHTSVV
jgi:hypothetical protein